MMRLALMLWLGFCALGLGQGWAALPGQCGVRTAAGWWQARQFEAAALASDLNAMARLGLVLEKGLGQDGPLLLASHRLGYQITAPSFALPPAEAIAWADATLETLEARLGGVASPWDARRIQADIIVNRQKSPSWEALGESAALDWFAAGGGPAWTTDAPRLAYWTALGLPAAERPAFLRGCLDVMTQTEP